MMGPSTRYLCWIQYAGHRFAGWQQQVGGPDTVCSALTEALSAIAGSNNHSVPATSSRTDAGVHAASNVSSPGTTNALLWLLLPMQHRSNA